MMAIGLPSASGSSKASEGEGGKEGGDVRRFLNRVLGLPVQARGGKKGCSMLPA